MGKSKQHTTAFEVPASFVHFNNQPRHPKVTLQNPKPKKKKKQQQTPTTTKHPALPLWLLFVPPQQNTAGAQAAKASCPYLGELGSQLLLLGQSQSLGGSAPGRVIHGNICHGIRQQTFVGRVKVDICRRQGAEGTE